MAIRRVARLSQLKQSFDRLCNTQTKRRKNRDLLNIKTKTNLLQSNLPTPLLLWCSSLKNKTRKRNVTAISLLLILLALVTAISLLLKFDCSLFPRSCPHEPADLPHQLQNQSPIHCAGKSQTQTCPASYPTKHEPVDNLSQPSCPPHFRWIYEDLKPWGDVGITKDVFENPHGYATFAVVIVDGKAYLKKRNRAVETRDVWSIWGLLQLLRFYPGRLPDMELMFYCGDQPVVRSKGLNKSEPPRPLFGYSGAQCAYDIVFPDWSFWGWAETNIRPWRSALESIKDGNKRIEWKDRVPYAYWKGNMEMGQRVNLMKCNLSAKYDWNARLYHLDWAQAIEEGYQHTKLADECTHKYKIYVEGKSWSVSEKFIFACNSMTLYIKSHFHSFFSRSLVPLKHYWPIRENNRCTSLKHAVDWANNHPQEAEKIGEEGSKFIHENLKMEFVYDYMFHVLSEYSKVLRFKPEIPDGAVELCVEREVCSKQGKWKEFMLESLVTSPSTRQPCVMPPPFEPEELQEFEGRKSSITRQVGLWEDQYWRDELESGGSNFETTKHSHAHHGRRT